MNAIQETSSSDRAASALDAIDLASRSPPPPLLQQQQLHQARLGRSNHTLRCAFRVLAIAGSTDQRDVSSCSTTMTAARVCIGRPEMFLQWMRGQHQHQRKRTVPSNRHGPPVAASRPLSHHRPAGSCIVTSALVSLLLLLMSRVRADWIDPDTPLDARTTIPLNVHPPPPLKPYHDDAYSGSHSNSNSKNIPKTGSPAPSRSPEPTLSPTDSPTAYPTNIPQIFQLVFSDEFNTPGRTFDDGNDPRWTALEKNDYTNNALHYYTAQNAKTDDNGYLVITSEAKDTEIIGFDDVKLKKTHVTKHFRSAMLQTWNKVCFTGGIFEAEAIMPGLHNVGGLWPAFWLLGNLARHTYVGSSNHVWPWSSEVCTAKSFQAQRISGCDSIVHYGMEPHLGRGSPEIDIYEVQPGDISHNTGPFLMSTVGQPFMSASFQVAPGRPANRPGNGYYPGPGQWYDGLLGGNSTNINYLFYGSYNHFAFALNPDKADYWSDAISYNRQLDKDFFERPHVYRLEWDVPTKEKGGYLHWFLDGEMVLAINGTSIREAGLGSEISTEPSYIILNTAISTQWGFPIGCPADCSCEEYDCNNDAYQSQCGFSKGFCDMMKQMNPQYKINYVRVYQNPDDATQKVGCSTPERPTRQYIQAHEHIYKSDYDVHPLKGIQQGRGICNPSSTGTGIAACGGTERGHCTQGNVCECQTGWTGPYCLTHDGSDPILYDEPDKITDVGFVPPNVVPTSFLAIGICVLVVVMMMALQCRKRLEGWSPIPETTINWENEIPMADRRTDSPTPFL